MASRQLCSILCHCLEFPGNENQRGIPQLVPICNVCLQIHAMPFCEFVETTVEAMIVFVVIKKFSTFCPGKAFALLHLLPLPRFVGKAIESRIEIIPISIMNDVCRFPDKPRQLLFCNLCLAASFGLIYTFLSAIVTTTMTTVMITL